MKNIWVFGTAVANEILDTQSRQNLIADKKVKNKNNYQWRQIANRRHIGAADQSRKTEYRLTRQKPHQGSDDGGRNRRPEAQANSRQEPLHEDVHYPSFALRIVAEKILRYGAPVPIIAQTRLYLIRNVKKGQQQKNRDDQIQDCQFVVFFLASDVPQLRALFRNYSSVFSGKFLTTEAQRTRSYFYFSILSQSLVSNQ